MACYSLFYYSYLPFRTTEQTQQQKYSIRVLKKSQSVKEKLFKICANQDYCYCCTLHTIPKLHILSKNTFQRNSLIRLQISKIYGRFRQKSTLWTKREFQDSVYRKILARMGRSTFFQKGKTVKGRSGKLHPGNLTWK